jgi:TonB family protein
MFVERMSYSSAPGSSTPVYSDCLVAPEVNFELFESLSAPYGRRWISFGFGAMVQVLGGALLIFLGFLLTPEIKQHLSRPEYVFLQLSPAPPAPPMPNLRPPRPLPRLTLNKPRPEQVVAPRLPEVKPEVKPELKAPVLTPEAKRMPELMPARVPKPQPVVGLLEAKVATPGDGPKMKRPGVRTDLFDGSSAPATVKRPISQVQTGGFGSPEGLPGNAQGGSKGNVAKLGSFDLPSGPGYGNGSGGSRGVRGTVASAGFGNGIATAGGGGGTGGSGAGGSGRGGVREGAFGEVRAAGPAPARAARPAASSAVKPVEILFKPNPVYTEEARRAHVEGEVLLSVIFKASGELAIVRVLSGLSYGLDDAAVRAAQQIRFKPAQRDGQAVDLPATLHIVFQLAS